MTYIWNYIIKDADDANAAWNKAIADGDRPKGTITQAALDAAVNEQKSKDDTAYKGMIDDTNKHWQAIVDGLQRLAPSTGRSHRFARSGSHRFRHHT